MAHRHGQNQRLTARK